MGRDDQVSVIRKILSDENRVVTTKYCSHRLHLKANECQQLLEETFKSSDNSFVPVFAVCYSVDSNKFGMKLVQGEKEADDLGGEKQLYALAPQPIEDIEMVCFSTDSLCMRQLLNTDPTCLAEIKCSDLSSSFSLPAAAVTKKSPVAMETEEKRASGGVKPKEKQQSVSTASVTAGSRKVAVVDERSDAFAKAKKQEKRSGEGEKNNNNKISKLFSKKSQDDGGDDEEVPVKKASRRKIIKDDDDDADDEIEEPVACKEEGVVVEEEEEDDNKMEVAAVGSKGDSGGSSDKSKDFEEGNSSSAAGSGARRLVEHTYVDEDGYFVTEKTWTHDNKSAASCGKSSSPPKPAAAKPMQGGGGSRGGRGGGTRKQAAASSKNSKQTSLTSFFKKM